jgi:2-keto-4-pentenoate hydratase/2-oxohepta-3-ene-1,7-dioic acid hydratase in catechol pathway
MSRGRPVPDATDVARCVGRSASAGRTYRDLCSTCNHTEACGRRSTPERPVFFCELFEAFVPVAAAAPAAAAPPRPADQQGAAEYRGLCMNCENRQTCTAPRPEGGVWHCEEYR